MAEIPKGTNIEANFLKRTGEVFRSLGLMSRPKSKPNLTIETDFARQFNPARLLAEKRRSEALIQQYREPDFNKLFVSSGASKVLGTKVKTTPVTVEHPANCESSKKPGRPALDSNLEKVFPKKSKPAAVPTIRVDSVKHHAHLGKQIDFQDRSSSLEYYVLKPNKTDRGIPPRKTLPKKNSVASCRQTSRGLSEKKQSIRNFEKPAKQYAFSKQKQALGCPSFVTGAKIELFRHNQKSLARPKQSREQSPDHSKSGSMLRVSVHRSVKRSQSISLREPSTRREKFLASKVEASKKDVSGSQAKVYFVRKPFERGGKMPTPNLVIGRPNPQNSRRKKIIDSILDVKRYITKQADKANPNDIKNMFRASSKGNVVIGKLSPGVNSSFRTADSQNITTCGLK